MNSEQVKKKNIYLILAFVTGSIISIAFAVQIFMGLQEEAELISNNGSVVKSNLSKQCAAKITELDSDLLVQERGEFVIASKKTDILDPYSDLSKISIGISSCYGYELKDFCMGPDCSSGNNVQFSLGRTF